MGNLKNEDSVKYQVKLNNGASTATFSIDSKSTIVGKLSSGTKQYTVTVVGGGTCKCTGNANVFIRKGVPVAEEPKAKPEKPPKPTDKPKPADKPSSSSSSSRSSNNRSNATATASNSQQESYSHDDGGDSDESSPMTVDDQFLSNLDQRTTNPDDGWGPIEPAALRHRAGEFWEKREDWGGTAPFPCFDRLIESCRSNKDTAIMDFLALLDKEVDALGEDGWKLLVYIDRPYKSLPENVGWLLIDYCLTSPKGMNMARVVTRKIFQCALEAKERGNMKLAQKLRLASALLFYRIVEVDGAYLVWKVGCFHNIEASFFPGEYLAPKWVDEFQLVGGLKRGRCGVSSLWSESFADGLGDVWKSDKLKGRPNIASAMANPGLITEMLAYIGRHGWQSDAIFENVVSSIGPWVFEHELINWRWIFEALLCRAHGWAIDRISKAMTNRMKYNANQMSDQDKKGLVEIVNKLPVQGPHKSFLLALEDSLSFLDLPKDIIEAGKKMIRSPGTSGNSFKQIDTVIWGRVKVETVMSQWNPTDTTPNTNYERSDDAFHKLVARQWKPESGTMLGSIIAKIEALRPAIIKGDDMSIKLALTTFLEYRTFKGPRAPGSDARMYHTYLSVAPYTKKDISPFRDHNYPVQDMGWGPIDPAIVKAHSKSFWEDRELWAGTKPPASFGPLWEKMVAEGRKNHASAVIDCLAILDKELTALGDDGWKFLVYPHRGHKDMPASSGWLLMDMFLVSPQAINMSRAVTRAIFRLALEAKEKGDLGLAQKLRLASALLYLRVAEIHSCASVLSSGGHNNIEAQFFPVPYFATSWDSKLGLVGGIPEGRCGVANISFGWKLQDFKWDTKALSEPQVISGMTNPYIVSEVMVKMARHLPANALWNSLKEYINALGGPWVLEHSGISWRWFLEALFVRAFSVTSSNFIKTYPNVIPFIKSSITADDAKGILEHVAKIEGGASFKKITEVITTLYNFIPWPKASLDAAASAKSRKTDSEASQSYAAVDPLKGIWAKSSCKVMMNEGFIYESTPNPGYQRPDDAFHQLVGRQWIQTKSQSQLWWDRVGQLKPLIEQGDQAAVTELGEIFQKRASYREPQPIITERLYKTVYEQYVAKYPSLPNPHCRHLKVPPPAPATATATVAPAPAAAKK